MKGGNMKIKRTWLIALCVALSLVMTAGSGWANSYLPVDEIYWNDYRDTGTPAIGNTFKGGIKGTDGWSGVSNPGFRLEWDIDWKGTPGSSPLIYTYYISGAASKTTELSKGLSHIIMQLSDDASLGYFTVSSNDGLGDVEGPKTFEPTGDNKPNPYMPANLYGIKVDTPKGDWTKYSFSIETNRLPVWGSFYAVDGQVDEVWATAINTGFTATKTRPANISEIADYVAVPNSVVPLPGAVLLLGAGLVRLVAYARRRED
jgi:hypothetical protein